MRHNEEQHSILKELLHELRTPIAALSYGAQSTNEIEAVRHIQNLCSRYEQIITDSYEVASQRVDIQEIIREVFDIVDSSYTSKLEHILAKVPALYVQADPLLLRQVLINIMTNARDHGKGDTIKIQVAREGDDCVRVRIENSTAGAVTQTTAGRYGSDTKNWGVGLPLASGLTSTMGGSMRILTDGGVWAVEVRLPAFT